MLDRAPLVAFVATADVAASLAFYRDVLGLALVDASPGASVFDANGTTLRVTTVAEVSPAPYTVLGWAVADIASTVRVLADRGVVFHRYDGMGQDEVGVWRAPGGDKVAWFADPAGNVLSLTEPGSSP